MEGCASKKKEEEENLLLITIMGPIEGEHVFLGAGFP
jgi:hypothetical protein